MVYSPLYLVVELLRSGNTAGARDLTFGAYVVKGFATFAHCIENRLWDEIGFRDLKAVEDVIVLNVIASRFEAAVAHCGAFCRVPCDTSCKLTSWSVFPSLLCILCFCPDACERQILAEGRATTAGAQERVKLRMQPSPTGTLTLSHHQHFEWMIHSYFTRQCVADSFHEM